MSTDHPLRYQLVNELHARPFPVLDAPATAVFLAFHPGEDARPVTARRTGRF